MNTTQVDKVKNGLILATAQRLLKANNSVTTLEIKAELLKTEPGYYWTQTFISICMDGFNTSGVFSYTANGTFRTYFDPTKVVAKTPAKAVTKVTTKTPSKPTAKATPAKVATPSKWTATQSITRTKAVDMMKNNKGHFFSVQFTKKTDNSLRTMNCQWLPGQTISAGLIKVKEAALVRAKDPNPVRSFDIKTVNAISIAGNVYNVKK